MTGVVEQRLREVAQGVEPDAPDGATLGVWLDALERGAGLSPVEAVAACEAIVNSADTLQTASLRCRGRRVLARQLAFAGRFADALAVANDALTLATEMGDPVEAGRARLASMHALGELGRLREAIAVGEQARVELFGAGADALTARADINLAIAYLRCGEPERSLVCLDRAEALVPPDDPLIASLSNTRGEALVLTNAFPEAEAAFLRAARGFALAGNAMGAAIAEGNRGDLAAQCGRLADAMRHFESARARLEKLSSPPHLARVLAEIAEARVQLGLDGPARRDYEEALRALDSAGLVLEAARARAGLARLLLRQGRADDARPLISGAGDAFASLGHDQQVARVRLLAAQAESERGAHAAARQLGLEALSTLAGRPADEASARATLAMVAIGAGNFFEAVQHAQAGRSCAEEAGLLPHVAVLNHLLGIARRRAGDIGGARAALSTAQACIERLRSLFSAPTLRLAWFSTWTRVYEDRIALELSESSAAAALDAAEELKSRVLLDLVDRDADSALITGERTSIGEPDDDGALRAAHAAALDALARLLHESGRSETLLAAIPGCGIEVAEARVQEIETRLAARGHFTCSTGRPVKSSDLLESIRADEAVVEYVVEENRLCAFVLRRGEVRAMRSIAAAEEMTRSVHALRFQIGSGLRSASSSPPRHRVAALQDVGDLIIEPLLDVLSGASRVCFCPCSPLHGVPFSALVCRGSALIDRFEIATAPSASVRTHLRATPLSYASVAEIFAVSDARVSQIAREGSEVALLYPASTLHTDHQATSAAYRSKAGRADILHLACHGRFLRDQPLASGLRLADRWLTTREIAATPLRASLVVLSGCETGRSLASAGEDILGLISAFLAAGAQCVVSSLWRVWDDSTADLVLALHEGVRAGSSVPAALRAAELKARALRPHPAFWAPFFVTGRS